MNKNLPVITAALIGIFSWLGSSGQNLVLNPSFENTASCPDGISEFYLCTDWSTGTTESSDSCSTPDLYAACSNVIGGVNVPNCLLGYHEARTGTHFAGIILGDAIPATCIPSGDEYREYIEGSLSAPLTAGQKYLVKFYASLADASTWGSNSLGIYFTNTQYVHDACPNSIINVTPQLEMCGNAIMDTVNWIAVQWTYKATGGEKYFTIGNFNNDANTNRVDHNCSSFNSYIYYYIDDVSVAPYGPGDSASAQNGDCAVTIETDSVNATCGASNGSVNTAVSGCSTPFNYQWSNGASSVSIQNVPGGTYTLSVTDDNNCVETVSVSVNTNPLLLAESASNPGCGSNNGNISISPSQGTGPYTYAWSNGATSAALDSLNAGEYVVTVNGAPGCTAVDSLSLLAASAITITPLVTNATCGNNNNGSVKANLTGGAPPYTYSWNNGQTTQTISGLAPGTYSVTVQGDTVSPVVWSENFSGGATGWTLNTPGTGSNGGDANQWIVNNDNTCQCTTGNYLHMTCNSASFYCLLQGGTCTYLEFPSALGFGDYTTDELAISPVISTVGKSNLTLSFTYLSLGNPGSDYGLVDLSNDGGSTWTALPTQYSNVENCTFTSISVPIAYQNISDFRIAFEWINGGGSITGPGANPPGFAIDSILLISSSGNCPATATATVGQSSGFTVSLNPAQPVCGQNNGSIVARVDSGTGPFTFAWDNGDTSQTISNLGSGLYSVTVTGPGGCTAAQSTSLFAATSLLLSFNDSAANCAGNDGYAAVSVSPAGNYSYLWSNGATTTSIANLTGATYTVTVTGQAGCEAIDSVVVGAGRVISVFTNATGTSCGLSDGSALVSASGGTGSLSYLWSNGSTSVALSNLASGTYLVTVTDASGCQVKDSAVVNPSGNTPINLTAGKTEFCSGDSTRICAPVGYESYSWNNGDTGVCISASEPGDYYVTVTDNGNCTASSSHVTISIFPAQAISLSIAGDTIIVENAGVSFGWFVNDSLVQVTTNHTYIAQISGEYVVAVTDSNGCVTSSNPFKIVVSGISTLVDNSFVKVYPNPSSSLWQMDLSEDWINGQAQLYDNDGRLVRSFKIVEPKSVLDVNVESGVYILKLSSPSHTAVIKLVKI